jgi:hypothetical protein
MRAVFLFAKRHHQKKHMDFACGNGGKGPIKEKPDQWLITEEAIQEVAHN